jgi:hypothetical protein
MKEHTYVCDDCGDDWVQKGTTTLCTQCLGTNIRELPF